MANLLSNSDISFFTGAYNDWFDTFKVALVVFKEPVKTISSLSSAPMYGYGDGANEENFTYTAVSGVYYAVRDDAGTLPAGRINEIENQLAADESFIKVPLDARDFIMNGAKNEKAVIEGKNYNIVSEDRLHNFLSYNLYKFKIKLTS